MKTFQHLIIAATLLVTSTAALAFRPVDTRREAERLIEKTNTEFREVRSHAELYSFAWIRSDGKTQLGKMIIIFDYQPDIIRGVFRILPDEDHHGITLINRQLVGEVPQLFLFDPSLPFEGELPISAAALKLSRTDWYCEGIFDDDKNEWDYLSVTRSEHFGRPGRLIEARYSDPTLAAAVGYDKRRIFVSSDSNLPINTEFIDASGNVVHAIEILASELFSVNGVRQRRATLMQIVDLRSGSVTVFTRLNSTWNETLPEGIFEPANLSKWETTFDQSVLTLLGN